MANFQLFTNRLKEWNNFSYDLWVLIGSNAVNALGTTFLSFLVLYLIVSLKFSPLQAANIFSLYGLIAIGAGPLAGKIGDRFGSLAVQKCLLFSGGIILVVFPRATTFGSIATLTAAYAICCEGFYLLACGYF